LEELRSGGAIGGFGVGVNEIPVCLDVMGEARLDCILLAGRYTLLEQDALDTLFPACEAAGTSIVVGGPYNSGILVTGTKGGGVLHYDYGPAPAEIVARVAAIEDVAARYAVKLPAAALQFVLAHPLVASVIPGQARPEHVRDAVALAEAPIPSAFWAELRAGGLLRADAPVPA
jgi:D-threo-aldose 1-dehydrogenase